MDPFAIYRMVIDDEEAADCSDDGGDDVVQYMKQIANTLVDIESGPSDPISSRNYINRNREGAHDRLVRDYFSENPLYDDEIFATRFRMRKPLFLRIVNDLSTTYEYFTFRTDARGRQSFTALQKCTSAIRQLAYGIVPDGVDEYLQMAARTSRDTLQEFCNCIIDLYGKKYLRRPTASDVDNLYRLHEERHGFRGMLGSIDCTNWEWRNCPREYRGHYKRGDHKKPTILLEAVCSQDLWIWHAFFGVAGSNNDINVLRQSPLFNDVVNQVAPSRPFQVNNVTYNLGYYLGDGIYPPWSTIVKSFSFPTDPKRKRFKVAQEAARKDVERLFGVLKGKFWILQNPARAMAKEKIARIMYACCILHNMILEDEGSAACPFHENELPSQNEVRQRNQSILRLIFNRDLHFNLQADLVEHINTAYVPRIDGREANEE